MSAKKEASGELVLVLRSMQDYLVKEQRGFYLRPMMAYCPACRKIGLAAGDYSVSAGSDCGGESYKTVKHADECRDCHSTKFVDVTAFDIRALQEFGEQAVIDGIATGLKKMNFPTLYNPCLPKAADAWNSLPENKKKVQIRALCRLNEQVHEARQSVQKLENRLFTA